MWPTVLNMWRGRGVKEWREKAGDRVGRRRDCVRVCGVLGGQQAGIGGAPSWKGSPQCWRSLTYHLVLVGRPLQGSGFLPSPGLAGAHPMDTESQQHYLNNDREGGKEE